MPLAPSILAVVVGGHQAGGVGGRPASPLLRPDSPQTPPWYPPRPPTPTLKAVASRIRQVDSEAGTSSGTHSPVNTSPRTGGCSPVNGDHSHVNESRGSSNRHHSAEREASMNGWRSSVDDSTTHVVDDSLVNGNQSSASGIHSSVSDSRTSPIEVSVNGCHSLAHEDHSSGNGNHSYDDGDHVAASGSHSFISGESSSGKLSPSIEKGRSENESPTNGCKSVKGKIPINGSRGKVTIKCSGFDDNSFNSNNNSKHSASNENNVTNNNVTDVNAKLKGDLMSEDQESGVKMPSVCENLDSCREGSNAPTSLENHGAQNEILKRLENDLLASQIKHSTMAMLSRDQERYANNPLIQNGHRPSVGRPILPIKKSYTSPLSLLSNGKPEMRPPLPPLLSRNIRPNAFYSKPLKEIHTVPRLTNRSSMDSKVLVSRSPSPGYGMRGVTNGTASLIERGNISDLPGRKHSFTTPLLSRSPSPHSCFSSLRSSSSSYSTCSSSRPPPTRSLSVCSTNVGKSSTPRRTFPQAFSYENGLDIDELNAKEQAPVVFDANLTFVLGCEKQKLRQNIRPIAAHLEDSTASSYLTSKIEDFLKRTDHVMDEWRNLGHRDDVEADLKYGRLGRSKSAANIMIKGFQYYSRSGSVCRSSSYMRDMSEDRTTISEADELSEMTAELAVEQSAGSLAASRLGAETAERLRLERDLQAIKDVNTALQQTSERLETELMYSRAEVSGAGSEVGSGDGSDAEDAAGASKYKRRLQAALRELEAAKRQLRQQHEDDLEQLVTLKKQLEKKIADAYEEAEEQRSVGAQWKRKAQKAASDANDLRLLLDEQGARAALLDKRQRRHDQDAHAAQEEARREKAARERAQREYDLLLADKYALEQSLSEVRSDLEMKEEKLAAAQRELEDMTFGGKTEEEVGVLKRTKHELEKKCHDQEEELDEMAGQLQLLESHKLRLEMSLEQQRKEARLEAAQRDEELEEARAQANKKVKVLEAQLESEHSERTLLLRERHELERRLGALEESARAEAGERDAREARAKRDLRRARALARDAQAVLERREKDAGAKAQLRQLRDKLDDAEVSLRAAQKAKQSLSAEVVEATAAAEEAGRARREAEGRAAAAQRDAQAAAAQLEEAEEEAAEVMKKYRACVQSLGEEQRACREASARATAAEEEARQARERAAELQARLASADQANTLGQAAHNDKLELRSKELETRLELEQTGRLRLEAQAARAREAAAAAAQATAAANAREAAAADELRKAMRTVRELREELATLSGRLDEAVRARSEAEARLEAERGEGAATKQELRDARARIALLQQAIADDLSHDSASDSENESYSSDESIETFLANHKASPAPSGLATPKSAEGRQSRSSAGSSSKHLSPSKESFA